MKPDEIQSIQTRIYSQVLKVWLSLSNNDFCHRERESQSLPQKVHTFVLAKCLASGTCQTGFVEIKVKTAELECNRWI